MPDTLWATYRESLTTDPLAPQPPRICPSGDIDRAPGRCPLRWDCKLRAAHGEKLSCAFDAVDTTGYEMWRGCPTYKRMVDDATG